MPTIVINQSQVYLDYMAERFLRENGIEKHSVNISNSIQEVGCEDIFGEVRFTIVKIDSSEHLKSLTKNLSALDSFNHQSIILVKSPRTKTRALEKEAKRLGINIIVHGDKEKPTLIKEAVESLNVNTNVESIILDYVGKDLELALSICSRIHKMHDSSKITVKTIGAIIIDKAGSVPPWDLENALFESNGEAIKLARRMFAQGDSFGVIGFLTKRIQSMIEILAVGKNAQDTALEIGEAPGSYPFKVKFERAHRVGIERLVYAQKLLLELSSSLKSTSAKGFDEMFFSLTIIELHNTLSGKDFGNTDVFKTPEIKLF